MSIAVSRPAADPGGGVAEPVGGDQGRDQGGVGALAVDEAHLATQHAGQVGEAQEGDGLAGPGGADHGHGLAPQLGRGDDVAALAPAGQVAVQGDPEGGGGELVVAGPGDQAGGLAVAGALVDALAAADEGAPLGPAGGPLGVPDRQGRGQQPDRDGQPHLGGDQVPEELADGDAGAGGAEAEVEGHVLPEVLGHEDVPAQRLLRAGHGQHDARSRRGWRG